MSLKIGFVTDLHFGPEGFHDGKLRKMTAHAADLTRNAVRAMNDELEPDLLVNLGDDIEDEDREADLRRYLQCQEILREAKAELVNVAGNHDTVHLNREDLAEAWRHEGPLFYSLDRGGFHLTVLHTLDDMESEVRMPHAQLEWLERDLATTKLPAIVVMHHPTSEQDLSDSRWFADRENRALLKERRELRQVLEKSGKVRIVVNGHVHRNHLDVIGGIPYVSIQSMIENLDEDAPGRPAGAYALLTLTETRSRIRVYGSDPARYQFEHR